MKIIAIRKLPIIIISALTIVFGIIFFINTNPYLFHFILGGYALTMFLLGIENFVYKKQKILGVLMGSISIALLFVVILKPI